MTFEEKIKEVLRDMHIKKNTHNWQDYDSAKRVCEVKFTPNFMEYRTMCIIISDWLDL